MSEVAGTIRILTVEDHPLIREGIAHLIAGESDMQLVADANSGHDAIQKFRAYRQWRPGRVISSVCGPCAPMAGGRHPRVVCPARWSRFMADVLD